VAVLLDQSRSVAAARVLLGGIGQPDIRIRAGQLLAELGRPEGAP
jgi:hypothetical protein